MTFKVIEDHKKSSNFSVNPTLPLLDASLSKLCGSHSPSCSLFPSLSLTLYLYIPLLLYAKINLHTVKCFQIGSISICHSLLHKVIPTLLLLDASLSQLCGSHSTSRSLFPSLSLTLYLYIPLLLYAKIYVHTVKYFQVGSISITHFCVRLYQK